MKRSRIILLIFLLFTAGLLIYTWSILLSSDLIIEWRHYAGLVLFLPIVFLFFKNIKRAIIGLVIYFLAGALLLLSLTPSIHYIGISFSDTQVPFGNPLCWLFFIVYSLLNFSVLIEIYLDYKEARVKK